MKKVKIIAEIGPNHNGSYNNAKKLIYKLSKLDVDFIKFQFANPYKVYSEDSFKANYQKKNDVQRTVIEMSQQNQLNINEHIKLYKLCLSLKKKYACSFFDLDGLKQLNSIIKLPFFKIPSGEICSVDMLKYISSQKKKVLLSTGMADLKTISKTINILKNKKRLILMHCVSSYPTKAENINLNFIDTLKKNFKTSVGFSDHTRDDVSAIGAIAKGAEYIEKHVTLNNNLQGPDHKTSLNFSDFKKFVKRIRNFEKVLGSFNKNFLKDEINVKRMSRKSIVTKNNIKKGERIKIKDICFKRPGTGFNPFYLKFFINKKVKTNILKNRLLKSEHLFIKKKNLKKYLN